MLFDWSSFYWKSILFWKTDTKRGFVAHIVQVTGGETVLARIFFPRANFSRPQKIFKPPLPDFEPENIPLHPVASQSKQLSTVLLRQMLASNLCKIPPRIDDIDMIT